MGEPQGHAPLVGRGGQPGTGNTRPTAPDAHDADTDASTDVSGTLGDVSEEDLLASTGTGGPPPGYDSAQWQRAKMRQLIREFLRAVPRTEPRATLALVRPDGSMRVLDRAQMSAAIDRLRPRMRQIVRLTLEERWPRQRVCEYLHNISMKTLERDQAEALDLLADL